MRTDDYGVTQYEIEACKAKHRDLQRLHSPFPMGMGKGVGGLGAFMSTTKRDFLNLRDLSYDEAYAVLALSRRG